MPEFKYNPQTGEILKDGKATGTLNAGGYVVLRKDGKVVYAHRLAWELAHGEAPKYIDHKNGIKSDNRLENLRNVSGAVNSQNSVHGNGIHFHKPSGRWKSAIGLNNKQIHLGYCNTPEEASALYQSAKAEMHKPLRSRQHA